LGEFTPKPGITAGVKKRVKFDKARFFRYLGENTSPGLLRFLVQLRSERV
jgi:hypothetical protein